MRSGAIFSEGVIHVLYKHTCKIQLHIYDHKEEQSVFGDVLYTIIFPSCNVSQN